jgi:hypothetical protein
VSTKSLFGNCGCSGSAEFPTMFLESSYVRYNGDMPTGY